MTEARFITALGTPLHSDDRLHVEGLEQHIEDQASAGIEGLLLAGTMGLMQMQSDQTWRDLVKHGIAMGRGRFEMLVGITEQSTSRVLDRVAYTNTIDGIDGVVALTPSLIKPNEAEQIAHYKRIADESRYPVFIYDLQLLTGVHLSVEAVHELSKHPNINGIKLSANVQDAVRLRLHIDDASFRIIVAEPAISDMLFRCGYGEHLDGIYAIAPQWATALAEAAKQDDWETAAHWQAKLTGIKEMFLNYPFAPAFTALMRLRGFVGKYAPSPLSEPDAAMIETLKQHPVVQELPALSETRATHVGA